MEDLITKIAIGIAGLGAGAYGMYRKVLADNRSDTRAELADDTLASVIATLREEVDRMAARLAAVEEQNRRCEERNEELRKEIMQLKVTLHVT